MVYQWFLLYYTFHFTSNVHSCFETTSKAFCFVTVLRHQNVSVTSKIIHCSELYNYFKNWTSYSKYCPINSPETIIKKMRSECSHVLNWGNQWKLGACLMLLKGEHNASQKKKVWLTSKELLTVILNVNISRYLFLGVYLEIGRSFIRYNSSIQ